MKPRLAALLVACAMGWAAPCPAASAPDAEAASAFHILRDEGVAYHGGEAPLRPGSGWLALDVVDGLWHLLPATLQGEQAFDDVLGDNTGVRIRATPAHAFLYLRLPGLVAGKVDTPDLRFKNNPRTVDDTTAIPLVFKGHAWRLDVVRHELFLGNGETRMSLGRIASPSDEGVDPDSGLALLWAGDLDRDGRLDLVFEGSDKNSGEVCVWLSSRATGGQLVGQAACWRTTGC